ncbi:excisionase [Bradyrhizobium cenepequi]|uniref:excisionase n=1 Tax=Bradyrhizobium cenepequi TaxID=2821403 RepID=UPI001CE36172|nr:excisionase [Bradyrhizobium cenepequi]MCA6107723.1 excisionase [Bradyrhizobium cenepequi]
MADSIDWTDDTPRRLSVIAELAFPEGGMTASSLRREAERGRLVIERIAGKDFTSFQAIAEMRKACRVERKETPGFPYGAFSVKRSGASWTVDAGAAEEAATSKLDALRAEMDARREKRKGVDAPKGGFAQLVGGRKGGA